MNDLPELAHRHTSTELKAYRVHPLRDAAPQPIGRKKTARGAAKVLERHGSASARGRGCAVAAELFSKDGDSTKACRR